MDDLTLLRKFEPVIRFTEGEFFFPCAVDEYLRGCSLWMRDSKGIERQILTADELSAEALAHFKEVPAGHTLYLRFVENPLDPLEYQRWLLRPDMPTFRAPGRLTRVGLLSRILDSFFSLSLLIRGTVPGGTAAAAQIKYEQIRQRDLRNVYYGRVIREGGYIVLHYLFFYVMNNWRSGFYGINDHEADWEQIFVYLSEGPGGEPVPRWVAFASHDFWGDDLRRRWDDPELHKVDQNHPVVYAGAGSHASYFLPGEYLMSIEPAFLRPLRNGLVFLRKIWAEQLKQGSVDRVDDEVTALLSVPFIDYARGDGLSLGPEQTGGWTPILLTESMDWVEHYRGLWGLDTKDSFGGERAPAGPKFKRDGSVRTAWYDPLGWAGLDKVAPPGQAHGHLKQHIEALTCERTTLEEAIDQKREAVRRLALEVEALRATDYLDHLYQTQQEQLRATQNELQQCYTRYAQVTETRLASQSFLAKLERGSARDDPQAHLRHKRQPEPPVGSQARIAELWAALSSGLLLLAFTMLLVFAPTSWFVWTVLVGLLFAAIDATIRGRLANFLLNLTIILAVITGLILIKDFWWLVLIGGLFALVILMIVENMRELWLGAKGG
jgi:hypothetical protein